MGHISRDDIMSSLQSSNAGRISSLMIHGIRSSQRADLILIHIPPRPRRESFVDGGGLRREYE